MRWLIAPILALSLLSRPVMGDQIPEPEIWFNPHTPADLVNMWTDDAPWQSAASKVKVLVLVHWWVRGAGDAVLIPIFQFAKRHHMKIALEIEAVAKYQNETCGGMEGYTYPGEIAATIAILKRLGVELTWADMDSPLWFGHYATNAAACQVSVDEAVNRTALVMRDVLAAYPNVQIAEIEPLGMLGVADWKPSLTAFQLGVAKQLGTPVIAVQADVGWDGPAWKQQMLDLHRYLRQRNLKFGVYYNATALATSDLAWNAAALGHAESVEGDLGILPDQAYFATWYPFPSHNLPETDPASQTSLINRYAIPLSRLEVQFVGHGAKGRLTTRAGAPIANATIRGFQPGVDYDKPLPTTVLRGVAPPGAVGAIIGVRLNTECSCDGLNDVVFGPIQYRETQSGSVQSVFAFSTYPWVYNGVILDGENVGGIRVSRVIANAGQPLILNSNYFTVTAGAQYSFTVPAATIGGAGWYGNVILIWFGTAGELDRVQVVPDPGKALTSTAVTGPDGKFVLPQLPRNVDGPGTVTVEFDGMNGAYRGVVWKPVR